MKKQVFNPFLPLGTYIPDGEPHVFGDRVYLFVKRAGKCFVCSITKFGLLPSMI